MDSRKRFARAQMSGLLTTIRAVLRSRMDAALSALSRISHIYCYNMQTEFDPT